MIFHQLGAGGSGCILSTHTPTIQSILASSGSDNRSSAGKTRGKWILDLRRRWWSILKTNWLLIFVLGRNNRGNRWGWNYIVSKPKWLIILLVKTLHLRTYQRIQRLFSILIRTLKRHISSWRIDSFMASGLQLIIDTKSYHFDGRIKDLELQLVFLILLHFYALERKAHSNNFWIQIGSIAYP